MADLSALSNDQLQDDLQAFIEDRELLAEHPDVAATFDQIIANIQTELAERQTEQEP